MEALFMIGDQLFRFSELALHYALSAAGALIIFIIGWIITGMVQRGTVKALSRIKGVDITIAHFLARAVRYGMLIIILVMILGQFGVQTASILAALGGAALAIGLALQGTLQNIAAGLMLLALRPFRINEYITAGSIQGTVKEIGLFTTDIITSDGLYISAPNSSLWNVPIINASRLPTRRHDYTVGIDYGNDINKAFALIRGVIAAEPDVLPNPEPLFFVSELADSAVILACRYWIKNTAFYPVSRRINQAVKEIFDKNGISIPYPHITYQNGDTPPPLPEAAAARPKAAAAQQKTPPGRKRA
ncbi:mechanosensitive ion channel family protein [Candidatus Tokpelaia sp.]|nr:mechanosensitive ion channel family protein [Candidatus Tokpelaia sp.]